MLSFELYRDRCGDYRWRQLGDGFKTLDNSAIGYKSKSACQNEIFKIVERHISSRTVATKGVHNNRFL